MGHTVGNGKIALKDSNIQAITEYAVLSNKRKIKQFLELFGLYRKLLLKMYSVARPLTNLLKKDMKFVWSDSCQKSFEALKAIMMSHPVLQNPDFEKPFILTIDASDFGIGAYLAQNNDRGIEQPVSYFSKKLSDAQRKYSVIEKETLALVLACQHYEIYLTANRYPIRVRSDHNPLRYLSQFKNKNLRLTRWSLYLQTYNLDIEHIKGSDNVVADALSRA